MDHAIADAFYTVKRFDEKEGCFLDMGESEVRFSPTKSFRDALESLDSVLSDGESYRIYQQDGPLESIEVICEILNEKGKVIATGSSLELGVKSSMHEAICEAVHDWVKRFWS